MDQLIQQLKVILGTNFALYFKTHGFHWNVEGSDFPQYHKFLGKLYTSIFNNTDLIAEKIRMLDSYAPGSLLRMLELADLEESVIIPSPISMLAELKRDNDRLIVHLRAGIVAADQAGEPAVGNFLQDLLDQHQKHAWMLRSFIK
jgi:starvation-inducible DNA-binding protein